MNENNEKKIVLRFRFVVIFAVLFLLAVFVVYMLSTSLEDVIGDSGNSSSEAQTSAPVTTTVTTSDEVKFVLTTTAEPEESSEETPEEQ